MSHERRDTPMGEARALLQQVADRLAFVVALDDDGRTDPLLASIHSFLNRSVQSETACRDAERWQFCMEHGFPKACYNPEQQVNYFYVRGDCCDDTAFGWDSPEEAVDATMQIIKERERESRTTRR